MTKKKTLTLVFLLISFVFMGYSQTSKLIFSDDLNVLAKQSHCNLLPVLTDEVRAAVVSFDSNAEALRLNENKRDSTISVSFWLKPKNIEVHAGTIFGEDSNFYFRYLANRCLQFNHYLKKDINTSAVLTENTWQHLAFTISSRGGLIVYFNGDSILTETLSYNWWKKKGKFIFGTDRYSVRAEGYLDELKIWSKVLNPNEIRQEYERTRLNQPLNLGLEAYLPLKGSFKDFSNNPKLFIGAQGVRFVEDKEKGKTAEFYGDEVALRYDEFSFDNQLTVSLWTKPQKQEHWLTGLVGNRDFSLRFRPNKGQLWFSVPMHFGTATEKIINLTGEWVHLAVSLNYNHKADYFINGNYIGSTPIHERAGKDTQIVIGKSLWGNPYNGRITQVAIWNRSLSAFEKQEVYSGKLDVLLSGQEKNMALPSIRLIIMLLIVILVVTIIIRYLKRKAAQVKLPDDIPQKDNTHKKDTIYFFSTFRAYDKNGNNISQQFTPILTRLFALVLLYPQVYGRHITSSELSDVLWDTDDLIQQKNNRGTNVHRLRQIFKQFGGLKLNYQDKSWQMEVPPQIHIDVLDFEQVLASNSVNLTYQSIRFCKALLIESFHPLLREIENKKIDQLRSFCQLAHKQTDWPLLAQWSLLWLSIESLSEDALAFRLTALVKTNRPQLATKLYNIFISSYKENLGVEFDHNFEDLQL